ncbi:hypothetical protein NSQ26_14420 [Bacillus sp. FSL W7-1360]
MLSILALLVAVFALGMAGLIILMLKYRYIRITASVVFPLLIGSIVFWYMSIREYHYVKSTDLSLEAINGWGIGQEIASVEKGLLQQSLGLIEDFPSIVVLLSAEHDESFSYDRWFIGVMDDEITTIVTEHPDAKTARGIKIGDRVNDLINQYGAHIFDINEEIGPTVGYVDRDLGVVLQFVVYDGRIQQIILMKKE